MAKVLCSCFGEVVEDILVGVASRWTRNKNYSRATWRGSSPHPGSLKLTAKAPQNRLGPKRKGDFVFQPRIFRGKLAVSFRDGIFWGTGIITLDFSMEKKNQKGPSQATGKEREVTVLRGRCHRNDIFLPRFYQ